MIFIPPGPRRRAVCACLLWLVLLPLPAAQAREPAEDVQQVLYSLGLHDFFEAAPPLLRRSLADYREQRLNLQHDAASLSAALAPEALQADVEDLLLAAFRPETYRGATAALASEEVMPVIQSCHGQALQDHGPQLQAYEAQLGQQPARPERRDLAVQMDEVARTSRLAARLHNGIDLLLIQLAGQGAGQVDWDEVEAERVTALQEASAVWYLYCARYYSDQQLQAFVDAYRQPPVGEVLDIYQDAVVGALQRAGEGLTAGEAPR